MHFPLNRFLRHISYKTLANDATSGGGVVWKTFLQYDVVLGEPRVLGTAHIHSVGWFIGS